MNNHLSKSSCTASPDPGHGHDRPLVLGPHLDGDGKEIARAIEDLFTFSGMEVDSRARVLLHAQLSKLREMSSAARFKFLKYKLSSMFAWALDQPLPSCPDMCVGETKPWVWFGGRWYQWVCKMKRSPLWKRLQFFWSYLMLKKGFPRPTDDLVASGEAEAFDDLTRSRVLDLVSWQCYHFGLKTAIRVVKKRVGRVVTYTKVCDEMTTEPAIAGLDREARLEIEVKRTVDELFPQRNLDWVHGERQVMRNDEALREATFPSLNSHTAVLEDPLGGAFSKERGRCATGGAAAEILRVLQPELHRFSETVRDSDGQEHEIPVQFPTWTRIGWLEECIQPEVPLVEVSSWRREDLQRRLKETALWEEPIACPMGLAESLKVRVISRGPVFTYAYLHRLQRVLWNQVRRCDRFLIDKPLKPSDIFRVVGAPFSENEFWLSGDYRAATNEIHPQLSRVCVDRICDRLGLTDETRGLFHNAMTDHTLVSRQSGQTEIKKQQWGQLMGSPVSFPILCIINAALTRYACFPEKRLAECPMLINGDDVLARTTSVGVRRWRIVTTAGGLSESVGKTYISAEFCNMNSRCFIQMPTAWHVIQRSADDMETRILREVVKEKARKRALEDAMLTKSEESSNISEFRATRVISKLIAEYTGDDGASCPLAEVPMMNLGLMYGLKRSGGKLEADDRRSEQEGSLGSRCHDLVRGFTEPEQEWLIERFVRYNQMPPDPIPWFLPESYGGVGLPSAGRFKPSKIDRMVAAAMQVVEVRNVQVQNYFENLHVETRRRWRPAVIPPPVTLTACPLSRVTMAYMQAATAVEQAFDTGLFDYQSDHLASEKMFSDFYDTWTPATCAQESAERVSRIKVLQKWWRDAIERGVFRSADDYDPSFSLPKQHLQCIVLSER